MSRILLAVLLSAAAGGAAAQDDGPSQLEAIVVTGTRISSDDYSGTPAVTIERRADFLVLPVELANDTREAAGRRKELHETLRNMVADAARQPGMSLAYGDDFLIPVTPGNHELPLQTRGSRPDTNEVSIYVKQALGANDDVNSAIARLEAFVDKARVVGRTVAEPEDEVALSIVNPERYRYEILAAIAADARKLQAAIGIACKATFSGLSSRVAWQRSDVAELTLYLPYKVELGDCTTTP
jgi:hypothetical protein